jgi:thiosulfate/3-mercaptopyruvate sulfurtransferase
MTPASPLVPVRDLEASLAEVVVLDASWIYPPFNHAGIDVRRRYAEAHVPGAWFLDLAALSDPRACADSRVPALAPPAPGLLRRALGRAGIAPAAPIVVTDMDGGCTTAPFARHALLAAGCTRVLLLDGGTPAWAAEARLPLPAAASRFLDPGPADGAPPSSAPAAGVFADHDEVSVAAAGAGDAQLVDSRAMPGNDLFLPPDYAGLEIPCGAVLRSGEVVEESAAGQRFKRPEELARLCDARGIDRTRAKITTCYFGVGASVVATALELAGRAPARVYTGSLVDWSARRHARRAGR